MQSPHRSIREDELLAQMGWVRDLARALVSDPALADDLAQETWLTATARPPRTLADEGGLRAWLATVVRNLARKEARTRSRRERREAASARPEGLDSGKEVLERGALHCQLSAHVMELEEPCRSAVLMRYLDGLPATEVARRQGVTHAAARKRTSRGLAQLRARLDATHGGDRDAWSLALLSLVHARPAAEVVASTTPAGLLGSLVMGYKFALATGIVAVLLALHWINGPGRGEADARALAPVRVEARELAHDPAGEDGEAGTRRSTTAEARGLEVLDSRGEPRGDLLALLLAEGDLLASARTDGRGRVEIDPDLAPEEVLLCRSNRNPVRAPLDAHAPDQRVVLRDGASVGGRASLGGAPGPAVLWLASDRPNPALEGLSAPVLAALAEEGVTAGRLSLALDGDGPFRFDGLEPSWTGALELPGAFFFAAAPAEGALDGDGALLLLDPTTTLSLELGSVQSLRGRAVAAEGGRGLPGVEVTAWLRYDIGRERLGSAIETDAEGRFELPLRGSKVVEEPWRIDIELGARNARPAEFSRGPDDLVAQGDLGDLPLELGRALAVSVRAEDGSGVPDATIRARSSGGDAFGRTDSAGRTELLGVFPEMETARVFAPGYAVAEAPIPEDGELEVELAASNHLEVRVVDADGLPLEDLLVRVECEQMPFTAELGGGASATPRRFRQTFDLETGARLSLGELRPGLALTLSAQDRLGGELASREVFTPPFGAHVVEELVVGARAFHVEGRVTDVSGRPLPRVEVHAEGEDFVHGARTDADGLFAMGPLYAPVAGMYVEVSRPGFMTEALRDVDVGPDSPQLELVMERGRPLQVDCVDGRGHPIHARWIIATFEGRDARVGGRTEVEGQFHFEAVPGIPGEVTLTLGGVEYVRPLGADETSLRVEVDGVGILEVALDPVVEAGDREILNLLCQPLDREGKEDRMRFKPTGAGFEPVRISLPVGRYRLQVESRTLGGRKPVVELLGEPSEVSVVPGRPHSAILP